MLVQEVPLIKILGQNYSVNIKENWNVLIVYETVSKILVIKTSWGVTSLCIFFRTRAKHSWQLKKTVLHPVLLLCKLDMYAKTCKTHKSLWNLMLANCAACTHKLHYCFKKAYFIKQSLKPC